MDRLWSVDLESVTSRSKWREWKSGDRNKLRLQSHQPMADLSEIESLDNMFIFYTYEDNTKKQL